MLARHRQIKSNLIAIKSIENVRKTEFLIHECIKELMNTSQIMINWESLSEMEVIVPMLLRTKNAETSTQMSSVLFLPASTKKNKLQYFAIHYF